MNGVPIAKAHTGISGLDEILHGGLPRESISLVNGGPGTGKTVLGLEFLYRGALAGEPGIFITFEERADVIRRNAAAMGWELQPLEQEGKLLLMSPALPPDVVRVGNFDLGGLLHILRGQVAALGAKRIVIDAIDVLLRVFLEQEKQLAELSALHRWIQERRLTALLTVKDSPGVTQELDYMVDCVLRLDQRVFGQVATRRLRVLKYRGSGFLSNEYPFVIDGSGVTLIPNSQYELPHQAIGEPFPTGVRGLDPVLGGGFHRGSSTLIAGASGSGKTTLACSFSTAAADRRERVLFISFEESVESMVRSMLSPNIDLRPGIETKRLEVVTSLPEVMGVEEHLLRILRAAETFEPDHLVIDTISACRRMGSEEADFDFLLRLMTYCRSKRITCLFTSNIDPGLPVSQKSIATLVDTIVVLEQDWPDVSHRRRLLIVKSRGARHSHVYHTFRITDHGIEVEPLKSRGGRGRSA